MHNKSIRRALLLAALAVLAPGAAFAQGIAEDYAPADPTFPFPLYSTHPEAGGLFTFGEFLIFRQTNPLKSEVVAQRGFVVTSPIVVDPTNTFQVQVPGVTQSGTFVGSGTEALDVNQVRGNSGWTPGFKVGAGWKFSDGSSLSIDWMHLMDAHTTAAATLAPSGSRVGNNFAESFLFSNVFNFPSDFGGPANKITVPNPLFIPPRVFLNGLLITTAVNPPPLIPAPGAVFGIWNGASAETIEFTQRFDQYQATWRQPIYETETYRMSGLFGPRLSWIWQRFAWNTTDLDVNGLSGPQFEAQYVNIVSNRLYGAHAGFAHECYLGHGVAVNFEIEGALFGDSVKEIAQYSLARGAVGPGNKRAKTEFTVVPEADATLGLLWFPIEGIEVHAGYNVKSFFNTVSSPQPIDFNYGSLTPRYETSTIRFFDGFDVGIGFIF
jgi:Legionella pneumophila major outer membrane protein precursor